MRPHHTKNKGDFGILQAQLDLAKKGYGLLAPITEHEAFDLVAYRDHTFLRVQVKYRAIVNGVIALPLKTCWADRNGVHSVRVDKRSLDLVCIYCPDTDRCYYVDPQAVSVAIVLRVNPQRKGIAWADDYLEIPVTVRGVPAASRL